GWVEGVVTGLGGGAVGAVVSRVLIAVTSVGQRLQSRRVPIAESQGKAVGRGRGGGGRGPVRVAERVGLCRWEGPGGGPPCGGVRGWRMLEGGTSTGTCSG